MSYQVVIGDRFNKLIVLSRDTETHRWLCRCDCGNELIVRGHRLHRGQNGCSKCQRHDLNIKHGLHGHQLYRTWVMMKQRCNNPKSMGYKNYGGRGIKVCERWQSFENFVSDVGEPPSNLHTIDRFPDNNGDYTPENFRWATRIEQNNNKRNNKKRVLV